MTQDYIDRLTKAVGALDQLIAENAAAGENVHEHVRLRGKKEGVQLALSYALEEQRLDEKVGWPT